MYASFLNDAIRHQNWKQIPLRPLVLTAILATGVGLINSENPIIMSTESINVSPVLAGSNTVSLVWADSHPESPIFLPSDRINKCEKSNSFKYPWCKKNK